MSAHSFVTIRDALIELRIRVRMRIMELEGTIETDNNTHITVVSKNGRSRRRFTIVNGRGTDAIPFGHLLKNNTITPELSACERLTTS